MDSLFPAFKNHIQQPQLIRIGDHIIVAFSGGKDSTALLLLLQRLQEDLRFSLQAAYYNHQIRTDSAEEESWVREFCHQRRIKLKVSRKNVREFAKSARLNLEKAAALSRYEFFRQLAAENKKNKIATAHTRSDLCETYFIKLFRGSGLEGLASIYDIHGTRIIRPLLIFSQERILSFLKANNQDYYLDATNEDINFLRNNLRHSLIPQIKAIEPRIEEHIYHNVEIIKAELTFLKKQAAEFLSRTLILSQVLPVEPLSRLPLALQRHVVREYIRAIKGDLQNIDFKHVESILLRMRNAAGLAIPGLELVFKKGFIYPRQLAVPSYQYSITEKTRCISIKEIQKTIRIKKVRKYQKPQHNHSIILPEHKLRFPLQLTPPQKNDQYRKINAKYPQRIYEAIRISGYPDRLRNLCPVLSDRQGDIIWVVGSPLGDRFKVEDTTGDHYLKIECFPDRDSHPRRRLKF